MNKFCLPQPPLPFPAYIPRQAFTVTTAYLEPVISFLLPYTVPHHTHVHPLPPFFIFSTYYTWTLFPLDLHIHLPYGPFHYTLRSFLPILFTFIIYRYTRTTTYLPCSYHTGLLHCHLLLWVSFVLAGMTTYLSCLYTPPYLPATIPQLIYFTTQTWAFCCHIPKNCIPPPPLHSSACSATCHLYLFCSLGPSLHTHTVTTCHHTAATTTLPHTTTDPAFCFVCYHLPPRFQNTFLYHQFRSSCHPLHVGDLPTVCSLSYHHKATVGPLLSFITHFVIPRLLLPARLILPLLPTHLLHHTHYRTCLPPSTDSGSVHLFLHVPTVTCYARRQHTATLLVYTYRAYHHTTFVLIFFHSSVLRCLPAGALGFRCAPVPLHLPACHRLLPACHLPARSAAAYLLHLFLPRTLPATMRLPARAAFCRCADTGTAHLPACTPHLRACPTGFAQRCCHHRMPPPRVLYLPHFYTILFVLLHLVLCYRFILHHRAPFCITITILRTLPPAHLYHHSCISFLVLGFIHGFIHGSFMAHWLAAHQLMLDS